MNLVGLTWDNLSLNPGSSYKEKEFTLSTHVRYLLMTMQSKASFWSDFSWKLPIGPYVQEELKEHKEDELEVMTTSKELKSWWETSKAM